MVENIDASAALIAMARSRGPKELTLEAEGSCIVLLQQLEEFVVADHIYYVFWLYLTIITQRLIILLANNTRMPHEVPWVLKS